MAFWQLIYRPREKMGKRMVRYVSLLSPLQFLEKSESRQIIPVQWSTDHLIRTTCLLQTIVVILFFPLSQKSLCASFFLPVCHPWPWGWMSLKPHISFFLCTLSVYPCLVYSEKFRRDVWTIWSCTLHACIRRSHFSCQISQFFSTEQDKSI